MSALVRWRVFFFVSWAFASFLRSSTFLFCLSFFLAFSVAGFRDVLPRHVVRGVGQSVAFAFVVLMLL